MAFGDVVKGVRGLYKKKYLRLFRLCPLLDVIVGILDLSVSRGRIQAAKWLAPRTVQYRTTEYVQFSLHGMPSKIRLRGLHPSVFMVLQHVRQLGELLLAVGNRPGLAGPEGLLEVRMDLSMTLRRWLSTVCYNTATLGISSTGV